MGEEHNHYGHRRRMMEKALKNGLENFEQHEIFEIMLFNTIARGNTNPIGHDMVDKFGSLFNACNAPIEELLKIKGVGNKTAEFLKMIPEITRAYMTSAFDKGFKFTDIQSVGEYCIALNVGRVHEAFYILCLDNSRHLVKRVKLAEGTPGEVYVEPRRIVEQIVHTSTVNVVICHNHPSGVLIPSQEDINVTERIRTALHAVDVELLESIIVADGNFIGLWRDGYIYR